GPASGALSIFACTPLPGRAHGGTPSPHCGAKGCRTAHANGGRAGAVYRPEPTSLATSTRRLEWLHSLSYQPRILTWLPKAMVIPASRVQEGEVPTMSEETIGSSV